MMAINWDNLFEKVARLKAEYTKGPKEKMSAEKLQETLTLMEDELNYEKSVADKFRSIFIGDEKRPNAPDAVLLVRASSLVEKEKRS